MTILTDWTNFYVITGSAAAALTGLMFVVITLVADSRSTATREGISSFSTPTVLHFCVALFISALFDAPWRALAGVGVVAGLSGLFGSGYVVRTVRLARTQSDYQPDVDDWLWHVIIPCGAYFALIGVALGLAFVPSLALFGCAGSVLLLIFVGIHNAWDVVTYIAVKKATTEDAGTDTNDASTPRATAEPAVANARPE